MNAPALPLTPYKGLVPYSEEDAPFFFGRDAEREIITANLMAARLTLLYGASGVGKSSILRAGVAHHLRQFSQQNLSESGFPEFVLVLFSSWRDDPIVGLENRVRDSITQILNIQNLEPVPPSRNLSRNLQCWTELFHGDLLIILDQFEEYFLYHTLEDGEGTFAVEFPSAVNAPDLRVRFLISIREDSLAKLDRFKGRIPKLFNNYLRIEHLDREAARAAIEKPIEQYNRLYGADGLKVNIEPALVEEVLEQVKTGHVVMGEAGRGIVKGGAREARIETPYLQLVMTRLWDQEMQSGSRILRLEKLHELGGAAGVVQMHLEESLKKLTEKEKDAAAQIFHYLVTPSGTKIAQTVPDLAGYAQLSEPELTPILEKLSGDVRILRPVGPPPEQQTVQRYEIFHDVLAPPILTWRQRYIERRVQERIRQEEQQRIKEEADRQRERERARRIWNGMIGLGIILMVLIALVFIAFQQRNEALQARKEAEESKKLAQQRLERIQDGIKLKQAALSVDAAKILSELSLNLVDPKIQFRASATSLGYKDSRGRTVYQFKLYPEMSSIPGGPKTIALITYKMDHPTYQNSLLATGPTRNFTASYVGWGCLTQVIAVIEYTDPDKVPTISSFNMCEKISW